jgi:hypothetical protein
MVIVAMTWGGALLVLLRLLQPPALVPGLFVAFPLLAGGLVLGVRRAMGTAALVCWWTSVVFGLAVLATQYDDSGGAQWGARYLLLVLPLLVPVALSGVRAAAVSIGPDGVRHVRPAIVLLAVALPILAVGNVVRLQDADRSLVDASVAAGQASEPGDGGLPVLISTGRALPRMAWDRLDDARWLFIADQDLPDHGDALAAAAIDEVVVVAPVDEQLDLPGYEQAEVRPLPGGWQATTFVRG